MQPGRQAVAVQRTHMHITKRMHARTHMRPHFHGFRATVWVSCHLTHPVIIVSALERHGRVWLLTDLLPCARRWRNEQPGGGAWHLIALLVSI